MEEIVEFADIKEIYHKGSLLLGNGSSIAVDKGFYYSSLFDKAGELGHLTDQVQDVFKKFKVNDFELVLRYLWQATLVNNALDLKSSVIEDACKNVREALIKTIRDTHVDYNKAESHLEPIYTFMQKFTTVISLNYDLIVYWAAQLGNRTLGTWFKDCFLNSSFEDNWEKLYKFYSNTDGSTLYFYPHGNLVLKRDNFSGEKKIKSNENNNLLDTILKKWETDNLVPAFVCEGTENKKRDAISSCNYFKRVFYEVIPSLEDTLVVYGWGFGKEDTHIIKQIAKSQIKKIAVSIYNNDQELVREVKGKLKDLKLEKLVFFNSASKGCWNNKTEETPK